MVPWRWALTSWPCLDGLIWAHGAPTHPAKGKLTGAPAQTSQACCPETEESWLLAHLL